MIQNLFFAYTSSEAFSLLTPRLSYFVSHSFYICFLAMVKSIGNKITGSKIKTKQKSRTFLLCDSGSDK
jgi:hypothetical protein